MSGRFNPNSLNSFRDVALELNKFQCRIAESETLVEGYQETIDALTTQIEDLETSLSPVYGVDSGHGSTAGVPTTGAERAVTNPLAFATSGVTGDTGTNEIKPGKTGKYLVLYTDTFVNATGVDTIVQTNVRVNSGSLSANIFKSQLIQAGTTQSVAYSTVVKVSNATHGIGIYNISSAANLSIDGGKGYHLIVLKIGD